MEFASLKESNRRYAIARYQAAVDLILATDQLRTLEACGKVRAEDRDAVKERARRWEGYRA